MRKTTSGFTLVELLIVIVVIAILAAITLVAYNGIQDRADATLIKSDLANINKTLQLYKVENSTFPVSSGKFFSGENALITKKSFSTSGTKPYDTILICSNDNNYLMIAKQKSNSQWYIIGSEEPLREIDSTGITGSGSPTCNNKLGGTGNYAQWIMTTTLGWSASIH